MTTIDSIRENAALLGEIFTMPTIRVRQTDDEPDLSEYLPCNCTEDDDRSAFYNDGYVKPFAVTQDGRPASSADALDAIKRKHGKPKGAGLEWVIRDANALYNGHQIEANGKTWRRAQAQKRAA